MQLESKAEIVSGSKYKIGCLIFVPVPENWG